MLVDQVQIIVKAGNGGRGAVSFKRNAQTAKGGPDGGNGGKGGDVYIQGINDIDALQRFRYQKEVKAEDGVNGGRYNLYGRKGKDMLVYLPLGTLVTDLTSNEELEIINEEVKILLAKGGSGGKGNNEFKTSTNQTPKFAEDGEKGEVKQIRLELKLIADVGIIGLPNAGKSSLLSVLTNAHPKIADYPFTTLEPNLGVMPALSGSNGNGFIIADIPGLIEGASTGKGLGDKFLKHIERTKLLVHCIDSSTKSPLDDYKIIRKELEQFNSKLLEKKEIIVLTKKDSIDASIEKKLQKTFSKLKREIVFITLLEDESINELKNKLQKLF